MKNLILLIILLVATSCSKNLYQCQDKIHTFHYDKTRVGHTGDTTLTYSKSGMLPVGYWNDANGLGGEAISVDNTMYFFRDLYWNETDSCECSNLAGIYEGTTIDFIKIFLDEQDCVIDSVELIKLESVHEVTGKLFYKK